MTIGILIGAGSVGKHHAKVMANRYEKTVVVDPSETVHTWLEDQLPGKCLFFHSISDALTNLRDEVADVTAVISHLAPDHHQAFTVLADAGIKRIVCEKPISDSLYLGKAMVDRAEQDGIRLAVGFQRRFLNTANTINSVATTELGGNPSALVIHGGAKCLVTYGSHFVDLAIEIFGSSPKRVAGFGGTQRINPRGRDLDYWEGSLTWEFSDNRYLSMTFTNQSSVQAEGILYAPLGVMHVYPDGRVTMSKRDISEIEKDSRVTRVGVCKDVPVEVIPSFSPSEIHVILNEVEGNGKLSYSGEQITSSLEASLGGLIAAETGQAVYFPIAESHSQYQKSWNVT